MSAVALAARIVLAVTLAVAALLKLAAHERVRAQMVVLVGDHAGPLAAWFVPVTELVLAFALVLAPASPIPGIAAAAVLVVFTVVLVRAQVRQRAVSVLRRWCRECTGRSVVGRAQWCVARARGARHRERRRRVAHGDAVVDRGLRVRDRPRRPRFPLTRRVVTSRASSTRRTAVAALNPVVACTIATAAVTEREEHADDVDVGEERE